MLNESALAVSANRLANKLKITDENEKAAIDETLLRDFVVAYFPDDELKSYDVTRQVITNEDGATTSAYLIFKVRIKVDTMLPLNGMPSFSSEIELVNSGRIKRSKLPRRGSSDFAFVLDFSDSMNTEYRKLGDGTTMIS